MIGYEVIRPPEGTRLEVVPGGGIDGLALPLAVPMIHAEQAGEGDLLVWRAPESGTVGIFQGRKRASWPEGAIRGLHLVRLLPGEGPGAVGLEVVLEGGEERPVLASTRFEERLVNWFRDQAGLWRDYLGHVPRLVDYGRDR